MRSEEPTKWLGEMPKRVLPERQPAVAKPSALDGEAIGTRPNEELGFVVFEDNTLIRPLTLSEAQFQ